MYPLQAQTPYIPDCLDSLSLNGILPYDAKAYIYDTPSNLNLPFRTPYDNYTPQGVPPYGMPQEPLAPQTKTNKADNLLNKLGKAALVTAGAILTGAILKKKLPNSSVTKAIKQVGNFIGTIPAKIQKLFKSAPKP